MAGYGHRGGLATIHANDTRGMLTRFCQLIEHHRKRADKALLAEVLKPPTSALDLLVAAGRRPSGLDLIRGYDATDPSMGA